MLTFRSVPINAPIISTFSQRMNRQAPFFSGILILAIAFLSGCKQDIGNAQWDVDVLAPVIKTKLTMADLVADSLLTANSEGALRLKIETPLIDLPLDSILKIPDTTIVTPIQFNFAVNGVPPGTQFPPLGDETQYELEDIALSRVVLRTGKLRLKVKSVLGTAVDFKYRIPGARLYGNVFEKNETVPAGAPNDTAIVEFNFDLSGYDIDLRGSSGSGFNTLHTIYVLTTAVDGDSVSVAAGQEFLVVEYSFLDIIPSYGSGYFGQYTTTAEDQNSRIDVLSRITEGQMFLDSVTIGLTMTNGVGADARFLLGGLSSINTRQNVTVDLAHEIIGNTILLTRAQDPNGNAQDVIPSEVHFELNNGNSNIKQFIENLPDELGFTFNFELNPLGNVSSGNDFFYYDRPFQALMDIDIPLRTTLVNLTLVDTLDWDLSTTGFIESVNSGSFTLVADNGFPLEGMVELILLDSTSQKLDTLVVPSTIAAPPLDMNNRVISPLQSRIMIPVPEKTTNVLPRTKKIRIQVRFNTPNQPDLIEFYDTYGIDLKLIGDFNINFGTSVL